MKTIFKREEFENAFFFISVLTENTFENRAFQKRLCHDNHVISLTARVLLKQKFKTIGGCYVLKVILPPSVEGPGS